MTDKQLSILIDSFAGRLNVALDALVSAQSEALTKPEKRRKGLHLGNVDGKTPETHPELFEDVTVEIDQVATLRHMVSEWWEHAQMLRGIDVDAGQD